MAVVGVRRIGLKVVSIVLAALLWMIVAGEQIVERALRIPLEFTNLPSQLELVGDPLTVVDVRVRGSSGALSRVGPGELVAVLDLRAARSGPRLFHLDGASVRAPFGVEVVQVTPSSVPMVFEPSATKVVPVVPEVEGEPAPGFVVGTVTAEPSTLEVVGPATAVKSLTEAITEPVSVTGAGGPVTEMVTAGVSDPSVRLKTAQAVRVTVNVTAESLEWAIAGITVKVINGARSVLVAPSVVTVHVRGPRDAMSADAAEFEASIDVEGLRPGQYQLPVRITPPSRVGVTRVEPGDVRVRIR
jgi:YbbR domain-containing protein